MPIKSYLALASENRLEALRTEVLALGCQVIPAENKDVLVVISETKNEEEDKALLEKLNSLKNLRHLTLVSAFAE